MDLKEYLRQRIAKVDQALDACLPSADTMPQTLHEAMRYSVFAGGKRLRPVLMMAACEAVGGDVDRLMPAACAMEMIHTYSLIHDDLPAMDDDDLRRGRPTSHKVYGEALAILAGDALLTDAFALLASPDFSRDLPPDVLRQVLGILARNAGSRGMVAGQVVDMESEGRTIDLPTLEYLHTHKTGALILASVQIGALVGGAQPQDYEALTRYGEAVGLCFQMVDDILDVVGDQTLLGKPVGSDEKSRKATFPGLIGLPQTRQRATELRELALSALDPLGPRGEALRQIARYVLDRTD